jgi:hypothetical protein
MKINLNSLKKQIRFPFSPAVFIQNQKGTASAFSCIEVFVLQTFEVNVGHTQWRCALRTGAGLF